MSVDQVTNIVLPEQFVKEVCSPYKVDYLKRVEIHRPTEESAPIDHVIARGEFSIPEPVYIEDTGHFNAVEFNMCYNMLVYNLIAWSVDNNMIPELAHVDFADFKKRQLSDILILELSSRYRKPITSARFFGEITIKEVFRKRSIVFLRTHAKFANASSGDAEGDVLLAYINN